MSDQMNLSDTSTWLPLEGLAPGFDASKAELSDALVGHTYTLVDDRGTRIVHKFDQGTVSWDYQPGTDDSTEAASKADPCEVVEVDEDLYYVQFQHQHRPEESVSLILDLRSGYALAIVAILGERTSGQVAVQHVFSSARIEELPQVGAGPTPTTELVGRRVLWVYSSEHAYEHLYLSPHWYTWQCLAGPEQGLADTDENTVWRIRPGIYTFTWREKVIPCGSVTIADHRDQKAIRSHGVLFGEGAPGESPTSFTFGAHGRLISNTVHPVEYDPARALER